MRFMPDPSLIAKPRMEYARSPRRSESGRGLGILVFIATLFLVLVGIAYGGIYYYRKNLEQSLDGLTRELSQLEEDLDSKIIQEIARVDRGLRTARSLLAAHVYSSNLFLLLEEHTLADVYYTTFDYKFETGVGLSGKARDFITLHRQLEELRSLPLVTHLTLESIQLSKKEESPEIDFKINIALAENVFRFR